MSGEPPEHEALRSHAFQTLHGKGPGSQPVQVSRVAQAAIAAMIVFCLGRAGYRRFRRCAHPSVAISVVDWSGP